MNGQRPVIWSRIISTDMVIWRRFKEYSAKINRTLYSHKKSAILFVMKSYGGFSFIVAINRKEVVAIEDVADYIDKIKKTDKKYIVIDEYTWSSNRKLWFTCP